MTPPSSPSDRSLLQPLRTVAFIGAGDPAPQDPCDFEDGRHPFVRTADVGRVRRSAAFRAFRDRLTDDAIRRRRMRLWPAGTILVPKSGASTVLNNRVRLAEPAYASSHLATVRARPGTDEAFLYHALCDLDVRLLMGNAGYPSISLADLGAAPITVPPLSEQKSIAEALDRVEEAVTEAGELIVATESLRDALRHELLTTGLPRFRERERERREKRVASRIESESPRPIGTFPLAWRVHRLGDLCHAPQYGAPAPARPFDPSLPRYVRITDITDDGRLRLGGARSADPSLVSGYELRDGDLLFARSGSVGRTFLYRDSDGPCVYAGYLIRFRVRAKFVSSRFLSVWTHSHFYRRWVASILRTGAQPNINATEYASLRVPVPPLLEQRAIVGVMDRLDATLRQARAMRRALMSFRAAVSSHLFRRGTPLVLRDIRQPTREQNRR